MHKKTILLVDDDPSVRKLLQAALEKKRLQDRKLCLWRRGSGNSSS